MSICLHLNEWQIAMLWLIVIGQWHIICLHLSEWQICISTTNKVIPTLCVSTNKKNRWRNKISKNNDAFLRARADYLSLRLSVRAIVKLQGATLMDKTMNRAYITWVDLDCLGSRLFCTLTGTFTYQHFKDIFEAPSGVLGTRDI